MWRILGNSMKKRRRIVEANINHCFQNQSNEWRSDLVNKIWEETHLALYENNFAWNANKRIKKIKTSFENSELLQHAQENRQGVLLLFRHNIFLELSARLISEKFEIYGMERPNNSPLVQKLQQRGRLKGMKGLIPNSNVKDCIELLKKGKTILYGPDQDYRNKSSVVSTFFDQKCLTTTAPFRIKQMTDCKLIYVDSVRQGDNYKFVLEDVSHFAESGQIFADKINSKIEKGILEAPEQYLWHHRRFKSQNPEIYD
tara:strand:+ start:427 stop:1197 length:771 start_codon:yes stop_codon:yes gene_type:complete